MMVSITFLKNAVVNILDDMKKMNLDISSHIHLAGILMSPSAPSQTLMAKRVLHEVSIEKNKALLHCSDIHLATMEMEYLEATSKTYICSTLNNAN